MESSLPDTFIQLAPTWNVQPPIEQNDYANGLNEQGSGARQLSLSPIEADEEGEDGTNCGSSLNFCNTQLILAEEENELLQEENDALQEENDALTELAEGTAGSCGSLGYNHPTWPVRFTGTICFSGVSGALTASLTGTAIATTGSGSGSGGIAWTGRFVDSAGIQAGLTNMSLQMPYVWNNSIAISTPGSDTATSTKVIPVTAVAVNWYAGGGVIVAVTYL
jgi:hypothetical protein